MIAIYYYSFSSLWKYYKRFYRSAIKNKDEQKEFIYENKLLEANRQADAVKHKIPHIHAEVRYYNGGEKVDGPMHPSKLKAITV
jgi:hypothetical protein